MKSNLFFIAALALIISCTQQGASGPQGATGPAGPQGVTGPQGANGATTEVFFDSVAAGSWVASASYFYYTFNPVAYISNSNYDDVSASVSTTFSITNSGYATWFALPTSNYLTSGDQFQFSYSNYTLTIWYFNTTAPANAWLYFKIAVTPSSGIKKRNRTSI